MHERGFLPKLRHVVALCSLLAALAAAAGPLPKHFPVPGGLAVIPLAADADGLPTYRKRQVMVARFGDERFAIVGIPLSAKPGRHELSLGNNTLTFTVQDKTYREQHLTIKNRRQVNPLPEDLERIRRDRAEMDDAFRHFEPAPAVTGFTLPATGPISSPFGLKRFLNEQPRSPHSGLDIAAPEGAPITAPAPCPPLSARPRQLSVTRIETWMRDPYSLYASHILKLKALNSLDADPGAADYGSVIHDALDAFLKKFPKELPANATDALAAI